MKVRDFCKGIVTAATVSVDGYYSSKIKTDIISILTGGITGALTLNQFGNPLYHLTGTLTFVPSRIADVYSTYKISELTEDARFKEYGISKYFRETSMLLPKNPRKKDLTSRKNIAVDIVLAAFSTAFPPIGYTNCAAVPLIYKSNNTVRKEIKKSFEIGDEVKSMLESGLERKEIDRYLDSLIRT